MIREALSRGVACGLAAALLAAAAGCGPTARLSEAASIGPTPELPSPSRSLVPVLQIAAATGWADGATPTAAEGTVVNAFATGLQHPRWLYVLPNGDVLVAETNAPPQPKDKQGIVGWITKLFMKEGGSYAPAPRQITLLRDADGDGVAETRSALVRGLNAPFGMVLVGDALYVANSDALVRFPYTTGDTSITAAGTTVVALPAGPINHHWTKNVIASPDGTKLYVTIGSNSNAGENGIANEAGRASIWEVDARTGAHRIFASGLRNPVGLAWVPETGALWVSVNERDALGSDLVPDYMTSVREGAFYGWPYSYFGRHVDERVKPQRPDLVASAVVPDYALGAHTSSLGLAYASGTALPPRFQHGMFVGQHGSWNRKPPSGYRVVFVPFAEGRPQGEPIDVLTDFLNDYGDARGRPVGVAIDRRGALLVADDVGNVVWRVTGAAAR